MTIHFVYHRFRALCLLFLYLSFINSLFRNRIQNKIIYRNDYCHQFLFKSSDSFEINKDKIYSLFYLNSHFRNVLFRIALTTSFTLFWPAYSHGFSESDWDDRNRLAAETWRAVDKIYYERSFNNQDWFKLRQEVVKKKYSSDEQLYSSLKDMLAKLGDKYTRKLF